MLSTLAQVPCPANWTHPLPSRQMNSTTMLTTNPAFSTIEAGGESSEKEREILCAARKEKEKKLKNLTALNNFPQCYCRYKLVCHARSISTIKINKRRSSYRKCVNGVIPQKLLADARNNFLNLVSREARKSFIKSLRTPTKRLFVLFIWFVAPVY